MGAPSPFWTSQAEIGPSCGQGLKTETWASQNVICLVIPWLAVWPQLHFLCQSLHRAPGTFAESLRTYLHFQMVFHARPKVQLSFWTSVASMKTTQIAAGFLFNKKKHSTILSRTHFTCCNVLFASTNEGTVVIPWGYFGHSFQSFFT